MKLYITVFASLLSIYSFAQPNLNVQTNERAQVNDLENIVREWNFTNSLKLNVEDVEGSAYLNEEFINGAVILATGAEYSDIPLRYNVYNEQIEFRNHKGDVFNINNPASINKLTIGPSKFIYVKYIRSKNEIHLFAEVIAEGKLSLLKHHRINLQPAKQAETHKAAQPPKFVKIPSEYLIKKEDGNVQLIKNKKELLNILSDKSKRIEEIIDREKLSVKVEGDLKRIVEFYNSN
jgi:hypothetical protein